MNSIVRNISGDDADQLEVGETLEVIAGAEAHLPQLPIMEMWDGSYTLSPRSITPDNFSFSPHFLEKLRICMMKSGTTSSYKQLFHVKLANEVVPM